jgi:hypothetical protein
LKTSSPRFAPVQQIASRADLGERNPQLGGAHRAAEGDEHPAAGVDVTAVRVRCINQRGGVEMTEVALDEG